jgi:hypothetical protein
MVVFWKGLHSSGDLPVTRRRHFSVSSIFQVGLIFLSKKNSFGLGDLLSWTGGKRDEKGEKKKFSIFFTARAVCTVN